CSQTPGLETIDRAIGRMEASVEDMLLCTRILESSVILRPEEVDLCAVVDEVMSSLEVEAKRAGSSITRKGARELGGRWDGVMLEQAIGNLLRNAIRFGAAHPVNVECTDLGDRVAIAISDNGIGIAPADHGRIFDRFARAVSCQHYGGLGLGLWLTQQ